MCKLAVVYSYDLEETKKESLTKKIEKEKIPIDIFRLLMQKMKRVNILLD